MDYIILTLLFLGFYFVTTEIFEYLCTELNSGASTPSLSPRKELNGTRSEGGGGSGGGASSGAWSEGEGSSAGASVQGDDDTDTQAVLDLLSATRTPQVNILHYSD